MSKYVPPGSVIFFSQRDLEFFVDFGRFGSTENYFDRLNDLVGWRYYQ